MNKLISAADIISKYTKGRLSARPDFYSGRGNNPGDLNSDHLEMIWNGVKTEVGQEAARAFVNMVAQMTTDASATTFLVSFNRLARNNWSLDQHVVPKSEIDSTCEALADATRTRGGGAYAPAVLGILGLMGRSNQAQEGDGYVITGAFLKRHSTEIDTKLHERVTNPYKFT